MSNFFYSNDYMKMKFSTYLEKLKLADSYNSRSLYIKVKVRPSKKTLLGVPLHNRCLSSSGLQHRKAEVEYEKAIEILEELLSEEPGLVVFLDRHVDMTSVGFGILLNAEEVPRLINSRSQFARRTK